MARDASRLVWFRRDLRLDDHAALYHALRAGGPTWCLFVFDTDILDELRAEGVSADRRVEFILASIRELDDALRALGGGLMVRHGRAQDMVPAVARELGVAAVCVNRDYEPAAIRRDAVVETALAAAGIALESWKDQVVFECDEVLTQGGKPFSVFTPYRNAWLKKLTAFHLKAYPVRTYISALAPPPPGGLPSLAELGFAPTNLSSLKLPTGMSGAEALFDDFRERIDRYKTLRDYPAAKGPSYLSVHLRFGTLSIRRLAREAHERGGAGAETWLSELIWRDFYFQILWHHPQVVGACFRPEYDALRWEDDDAKFSAWCEGRTGYPLVDAAQRQLAQTGYMHNRLRMVSASFLTKDLGIDWRRGEHWFARQLNDFDLAANNGGWQWAASTGCDAQPWFRIFNPVTQSQKFDADGQFIRRYCPELAKFDNTRIHAPWLATPLEQKMAGCAIGSDYPAPIVDHAQAREATLARFKAVKGASEAPED
ncbi:cryptochrome/photolyase family protein [Methyloversatilis thermotolerans]|uniref:cryptochrome/photolyase family protein n=1 Tax=Methyloversatilis thermotolerans TaxID=1346290 RepID=UPI00039A5D15|nr:deoxyribodipyrimidine photo-lyase [Methyloversatilis thermotolerans]